MDTETKGPPGRFIVFDGGEGVGKSTALKALSQILPANQTITTREPGGTHVATEIRRMLLDPETKMEVLTEFLLFWSARAEHIGKIIRPALLEGKLVLSDRFDSSTFAYQIRGRQHPELIPVFEEMRRICCGEVKPDLYIFFDLDPLEGVARLKGRDEVNHFDQQKLDFHYRVREGFKEFLSTRPHEIVDASQSPDKVVEDILKIIQRVQA